MPDEEQDKEHIYPLETEMPIGLGLSVKAFGQLSAMTSLMAPESEQLPVEVALVFENHGADSVVFEVDTNSAILVSSDGKDYRAEGFSVLLPDLTQHVQGGSGPVPFWLPAGK